MLVLTWVRGLIAHRRARLLSTATGVAVGVARVDEREVVGVAVVEVDRAHARVHRDDVVRHLRGREHVRAREFVAQRDRARLVAVRGCVEHGFDALEVEAGDDDRGRSGHRFQGETPSWIGARRGACIRPP